MCLLTGCNSVETMETIRDECFVSSMTPPQKLVLQLPESAGKHVLSSDETNAIYFCDGYSLTVETMDGGDLRKSVREVCGFEPQDLMIMKTSKETYSRYDWVFSVVGEEEIQVGRAALLDDGNYHYCVTVLADETAVIDLDGQWNEIFSSLSISN
jgi:hypothetical protein